MSRKIDDLFDGLKLLQDDRFFKLGQDSFLLADFAKVKKNDKICDLGCGNGAISVILFAKNREIEVDAVEIQEEVAKLAEENAKMNDLKIKVYNNNANLVHEFLQREKYNVVISNPPYFKKDSGFEKQEEELFKARVETDFDIKSVCKSAKYLLKYGGNLYVVQKPDRISEIFVEMTKNGIEPKRLKIIQSTWNSSPSAVLVEGKKGGKPGVVIESVLITRNEDYTYTKEMKDIYKI